MFMEYELNELIIEFKYELNIKILGSRGCSLCRFVNE